MSAMWWRIGLCSGKRSSKRIFQQAGNGHGPHSARHRSDERSAFSCRVELDVSDNTLGKKIRNAKEEKVPYALVIGDKELTEKKVTVESRDAGKVGEMSADDIVIKLKEEIQAKK